MTWPPSSCPAGMRFSDVTSNPHQPAKATGWRKMVWPRGIGPCTSHARPSNKRRGPQPDSERTSPGREPGHHQPGEEGRNRCGQTGQRPRHGHVHQGVSVRNPPAYADDRAERPQQRGGRQEIGQRCVHPPSSARDVMAHLVRAEYQEQRQRIGKPSQNSRRT